MTLTRNSPVTIKLLNSDEEILNLWPTDSGYRIVIKNSQGAVYIVAVHLDENKIPRFDGELEIFVTYKDSNRNPSEISTEIKSPQGKIKVTAF
ncbi:hypothetical protein VB712_02110 [Spirulina sp. CCNP1310]|uniref:hypothetical protein n=1 Tax=Spirulina sp. CCNP1310 TaxID=3110249 RepID=UPI002B20AD74|nr:hypothetical protein [Spirulina sp. CCNP1310]MEA5417999.1 hypothetical protein [Spirulina sp. CCNP1310]